MLENTSASRASFAQPNGDWLVDSEYGLLTDVLLGSPEYLAPVPACSVTIETLRKGETTCTATAEAQHRGLVRSLRAKGIRCHVAPARPDLPDLTFARDSVLMTPWGLLELRPAADHRRAESGHMRAFAEQLGCRRAGALDIGHVEGGDVSIARPGLLIVGCSEARTDRAGAAALARVFEHNDWRTLRYDFDPHFLHLDTQFSMVDEKLALACTDVLDDAFIAQVQRLGIELIPVSYKDARRLGCNVLSIGARRVISAAGSQVAVELTKRDYDVTQVDIDQFTRCGGGLHCLTMPLAREPESIVRTTMTDRR